MARDGNGNYSLPVNSWNPAANGVSATPVDWQALISDVASALTQSISRDGQTPISGNLTMTGNRVTGLGSANANGQAIAYGQSSASLAGLTLTGALTMTAAVVNYAAEASIVSAATVDLGGAASNQIQITGNTGPITSFGTNFTGPRFVRLASTPTFTNSASLVLPGGANIVGAPGDTFIALPLPGAAGWVVFNYIPASGFAIKQSIVRSALAGCTMSTAGSSATMSIAAGQAVDSTNVDYMALAAISKTTAAWAVGSAVGGLDTGAIANATWYHFYVIKRPDTGVVDVVFSTNATSPTLPASYTLFRRIGSGLTNGSAQWVQFVQSGDFFQWSASVLDVNVTGPGSAAVLRPLTVPLGINVRARINVFGDGQAIAPASLYISDPAVSDETPSITGAPLLILDSTSSSSRDATWMECRTNTSQQIRTRNLNTGNLVIKIATLGWFDDRGRYA